MPLVEIKPYKTYSRAEILPLYSEAGWTNYSGNPEMLDRAYKHSLCVLAAYEEKKLVGVIRAVGDGASVLYIQDIIVSLGRRRRGIGTALVTAILEKYKSVYQKLLLCDKTPESAAFYSSLGFRDCEKFGCRAYIIFKTE